jgi:hypothetical protein
MRISIMHFKGQCHEIFDFRVFRESVSLKSLRPFRFFSKIRENIRTSRCTTGAVDTVGRWKKFSTRKVLIMPVPPFNSFNHVGRPLDIMDERSTAADAHLGMRANLSLYLRQILS